MIKIKIYPTLDVLLTKKVLHVYLTQFWNEIFSPIKNDKHLWLMCKVNYSEKEQGYKTLGHLRRVNYNDKELFLNYLSERLNILNDSYTSLSISNITFSYIINEGLANKKDRKLLENLEDKTTSTHRFNNYNLPISMHPSDYGKIIAQTTFDTITRFIVNNGPRNYQIDISLDGLINNVTILGPSDFKWMDVALTEGFQRIIGKSTIYFVDGEIVLRKQQLPAKSFTKISKEKVMMTNFVTMDIETVKHDFQLIPYLICAYNGFKSISTYGEVVDGVINQKLLFSTFITQLLTFFNKNTKSLVVYAHNFSGFDGVFFMKHLLPFGKVDPIIHNGKIITIKLTLNLIGYTNKTIIFKDSMLLLPLGLRKLCVAFGVTNAKTYFPFGLSNIFYKGELPPIELWKGIPNNEYTSLIAEFISKVWDFKAESIKYCKLDCVSLHQVLVKFNELIFNEFKINIHKTLTLPSLASKIYNSSYMPENTIYQLLGNVEKEIRESYTGGAVDVYIPHNRSTVDSFFSKIKAVFTKLYQYDANSLYPTVMAKHPMPIGKPTIFDGDIRKVESNAFGFFYCNIISPAYLKHPILQRRIKTNDGIRTIAGLGSWTGWICSSEMDNAINKGYKFEILRGYQFETGDIFSDYITKMYNLRMEYVKGHPMNLIAKLLMNSLYGKFGMGTEITKVEMFNCSDEKGTTNFRKMLQKYGTSVKDFVQLDNTYIIIRNALLDIQVNENDGVEMYHGQNINIAIASTITAGARVYMSAFKNRTNFNLYYSDTDSIIIDALLPTELVGSALSQFKLENVIERAVFLAPKVYGYLTESGQEIIKVKGIKDEIASELHINDLESLLIKETSKEFTQEKWFKNVIGGEISIQDVAYTLKITSNKRQAIYVNRLFKTINVILKFIILINIILGVGLLVKAESVSVYKVLGSILKGIIAILA